MPQHTKLIYGLKDGEGVYIDEVESGLKCGCVCPACGDALVAKKGPKMMHHFAHHSALDCEHGYESALHLAAKDILSKAKRMKIPPVKWNDRTSKHIYFRLDKITESKEITIDKVELESNFGDIVPDIVIYSGGKKMFVEIYVTHGVDDEKLRKLKEADISTIQIDLSHKKDIVTKDELEELLLNGINEKEWLYNSYAEKKRTEMLRLCKKMRIYDSPCSIHGEVANCPLKMNKRKGSKIYFANHHEDCGNCEFYIAGKYGNWRGTTYIFCSGQEYISSLEDFKIPKEERYKKRDERARENSWEGLLDESIRCEFCGSRLKRRVGVNGAFLGCTNYPKCKYTR